MKKKKIIIVGAGLCGTLLAIILAKEGFNIFLYEKRPDLRKSILPAGRSINLALSNRGFNALKMAGLEEKVRKLVIPMYGRLIHAKNGETKLYRYSGRKEDYINSISRPGLNTTLLEEAEKYPNLNLYFDSGCEGIDFQNNIVSFFNEKRNERFSEKGDIIIGTDGAGSALRNSMLKISPQILFNYSQDFLDTGYKELTIPAGTNNEFRIEKNALHIWPREGYMLIALPNLDGSFTVTLFMPFYGKVSNDSINTDEKLLDLFQNNFQDAFKHMPNLVEEYSNNPFSALGTIKCSPWHVNYKSLLLGDAAHAIVPFYGQGMNCAFEDCVVLRKKIVEHAGNWHKIISQFSLERKKDTDAIADLAKDNFIEMRDSTADPLFNKKRRVEIMLEQLFPDYFSKYSLVTFRPDLSYYQAMKEGRCQDEILMELVKKLDEESIDYDVLLKQLKKMKSMRIYAEQS